MSDDLLLKTKEYFSAALRSKMQGQEWGVKSNFAKNKSIPLSQQQFSKLMLGKSEGKEAIRRQIAHALGYGYDEFLRMGKEIYEKEAGSESNSLQKITPGGLLEPKKAKLNRKFISLLRKMTEVEFELLEGILNSFLSIHRNKAANTILGAPQKRKDKNFSKSLTAKVKRRPAPLQKV